MASLPQDAAEEQQFLRYVCGVEQHVLRRLAAHASEERLQPVALVLRRRAEPEALQARHGPVERLRRHGVTARATACAGRRMPLLDDDARLGHVAVTWRL